MWDLYLNIGGCHLTNQTGSVRNLWSNSKEISHCCSSWCEVTEFARLQIDPHGAGKLLQLACPSYNPWIPLMHAGSSFVKWWITDQRLSLWWSLLNWFSIESTIIIFSLLISSEPCTPCYHCFFFEGDSLNSTWSSHLLGTLWDSGLSPSPAP